VPKNATSGQFRPTPNGGELDEMLGGILQVMGASLSIYTKPHYREILDELRVRVRAIYDRGLADGYDRGFADGADSEQDKGRA
jgi:hypothetical protein